MELPRIKWTLQLSNSTQNIPQEEIGRELALPASRTWNLEDCLHLPAEYRRSCWSYNITEVFGGKSIENAFAEVKSVLIPISDQLKSLIRRYDLEIEFVCVIEAEEGDGPEVILEPESMRFIADLNARLCFDLYYG